MGSILYAVILVTAIGLVAAVLLVVAGRVMAVPVDEKFEQLRACLPGANCGACGYAGCDGYAKALASGESTDPALCVPGGDGAAAALAAALGVKAGAVQRKVAFIQCDGTCAHTRNKYDYEGVETCAGAELLFAGPGECTFGCMGFGDCARVCSYDAICIENGIAHIDPRKCRGCGACTKVCPNSLIHVLPANISYFVSCGNQEKGAMTRQRCSAGCIGCKKCERSCEAGAITVQNNLARIDYEKCTGCGACAEACPSGCIRKVAL